MDHAHDVGGEFVLAFHRPREELLTQELEEGLNEEIVVGDDVVSQGTRRIFPECAVAVGSGTPAWHAEARGRGSPR